MSAHEKAPPERIVRSYFKAPHSMQKRWREAAAERNLTLHRWMITILNEEIDLLNSDRVIEEEREINSLKPKRRRRSGSQEE